MRVSPIGFAFDQEDIVLAEAARSAETTHHHPEGIKGAGVIVLAIFLARTTKDKDRVRAEISRRFGYDLSRTLDQIRPSHTFDLSCTGTVPVAILSRPVLPVAVRSGAKHLLDAFRKVDLALRADQGQRGVPRHPLRLDQIAGNDGRRARAPRMTVDQDPLARRHDVGDEPHRLPNAAGIVAGSVDQWDAEHLHVLPTLVAAALLQAQDRVDPSRQRRGVPVVADRDLIGDSVHVGCPFIRPKSLFENRAARRVEGSTGGRSGTG